MPFLAQKVDLTANLLTEVCHNASVELGSCQDPPLLNRVVLDIAAHILVNEF